MYTFLQSIELGDDTPDSGYIGDCMSGTKYSNLCI